MPSSIITGQTNICPSLSPDKRATIDRQALQRERTRVLAADAQTRAEAAVAPDGSRPNNEQANLGIPLHGTQVMQRLARLNKSLWFEVANADDTKMGCYVLRPSMEGGQDKVFIAGFEREMNPEFTTKLKMEDGRIKIVRGYRTLLARLIQRRLVTETGINSLFGPPSRDSQNWALFTR